MARAKKKVAKKKVAKKKAKSKRNPSELEGPFRFPNGRVVYYDPGEGKYYDRATDLYLSESEVKSMQSGSKGRAKKNPSRQAGGFYIVDTRIGKVVAGPYSVREADMTLKESAGYDHATHQVMDERYLSDLAFSAKKNPPKKKAAKKKAAKKKVAKKKVAKKKVAKKRSSTLRKVPHTQYELVWDAGRNKCFFGSKSGISGEVGCGVTDTVTVYTDGVAFYILSLNYAEGYGCVEVLDEQEDPMGICFADADEMRAMFKKDVDKLDPRAACRRLSKECL